MRKCKKYGQPIIFRRWTRHPITGKRVWSKKGRAIPIHLNGACGKIGSKLKR